MKIYKYYEYKIIRDYHLNMEIIINSELDNENDPKLRKRLYARRSHHRKLYRKYEALAEICLKEAYKC